MSQSRAESVNSILIPNRLKVCAYTRAQLPAGKKTRGAFALYWPRAGTFLDSFFPLSLFFAFAAFPARTREESRIDPSRPLSLGYDDFSYYIGERVVDAK